MPVKLALGATDPWLVFSNCCYTRKGRAQSLACLTRRPRDTCHQDTKRETTSRPPTLPLVSEVYQESYLLDHVCLHPRIRLPGSPEKFRARVSRCFPRGGARRGSLGRSRDASGLGAALRDCAVTSAPVR